jgi:uncharacterized protein YkwD
MKKGNENIVCGSNLAREALITLLIDSGIPGYGHRENLLNNEWTHAACFFVGEIKTGLSCNYWIQNFGAVK